MDDVSIHATGRALNAKFTARQYIKPEGTIERNKARAKIVLSPNAPRDSGTACFSFSAALIDLLCVLAGYQKHSCSIGGPGGGHLYN